MSTIIPTVLPDSHLSQIEREQERLNRERYGEIADLINYSGLRLTATEIEMMMNERAACINRMMNCVSTSTGMCVPDRPQRKRVVSRIVEPKQLA